MRYLGGAGRAGGVREVVDGYLAEGIGIHQMPCPEQRAWGGVLKPRMLAAYGGGGTWRAPAVRLLLRPFLRYTRMLDLRGATDVLSRCPLAQLDRRTLNDDVIAAHVHPGEGMFVCALRRRIQEAGMSVPFEEHDLLRELGVAGPPEPEGAP